LRSKASTRRFRRRGQSTQMRRPRRVRQSVGHCRDSGGARIHTQTAPSKGTGSAARPCGSPRDCLDRGGARGNSEHRGGADRDDRVVRDRSGIAVGSARAGFVGLDHGDVAPVGAKSQRGRQANDAAAYDDDVRRNPAHLIRGRFEGRRSTVRYAQASTPPEVVRRPESSSEHIDARLDGMLRRVRRTGRHKRRCAPPAACRAHPPRLLAR
jgi:hypothetical protein